MWYYILNPNIAYIIIWSFTAFLINLRLTTNLKELEGEPALIIYITCIVAVLYNLIFKVEDAKKRKSLNRLIFNSNANSSLLHKFSKSLYKFWLCLVMLDFLYSGSFPLVNIILGNASGYSDLGIPSVKGLTHTLYYLNSTLFFCEIFYVSKEIKNYKFRLTLIVIYPFLMLSRALLVGIILQVIFCYLYRLRFKLILLFKILFWICVFVIIFGIVGDYRGEYQNPFSFLIDPNYDVLNRMPSGVTWIYIYITANFNNILLSHGTFIPNGSFEEIFYNLIPGALKAVLFSSKNTDFSPVLLDENLNVASMYVGYVSGFGVLGAIIGGAIFLFVGNLLFFYLLKYPNIGLLMANSVFFSCVIVSIFFDSFLTVSSFAQIFYCLILSKMLIKSENKNANY